VTGVSSIGYQTSVLQRRLPPRPLRGWPGPFRRMRSMLPWACALTLFVLYALFSVQRHRQLETSGFDLGIFEQEVRCYAHGHLPTSTLKGPGYPLLGDHFSPITMLIAPIYRVFPFAITLLVVQAALLAVAVVPIAGWAERTVGRQAALVIAAGYGLSWGIVQTVGFDFHEVAFAVPLLAFSAVALGEYRLRAAVLCAAPLVLVKEDLGLTLAVVGALVAWRGAHRLGLLTAAGGIAATVVEMKLIIAWFNPNGTNAYLGQVHGAEGALHQLLSVFNPDTKIVTVALLLAPTAFLAARSPLLLLTVPTLAWRFLSDNPAYWGTLYHYSAVLMPVVFVAFIDTLRRQTGHQSTVLVVSMLATACLATQNPFIHMAHGSFWRQDSRVTETKRLLDSIPSGATVSASNWLAPQLTNRDDVSLFGAGPQLQSPEYLIVDTEPRWTFPISAADSQLLLDQAEQNGYTVIQRAAGVILLRHTT
jgi:uncharacterized membrane protein